VARLSLNEDTALARDLCFSGKAGGDTSLIGSLDKLKRFVGVNRALLEAEL
jgi:hypothetical protein